MSHNQNNDIMKPTDYIEWDNLKNPFRRESFSNASQTIVATLTWNFSFGKTHSSSSKSLNNQDADYGVKSSYK